MKYSLICFPDPSYLFFKYYSFDKCFISVRIIQRLWACVQFLDHPKWRPPYQYKSSVFYYITLPNWVPYITIWHHYDGSLLSVVKCSNIDLDIKYHQITFDRLERLIITGYCYIDSSRLSNTVWAIEIDAINYNVYLTQLQLSRIDP